MLRFKNSPFSGELDVVAALSGRAIEARVAELKREDELTLALRAGLRQGVSIDDLSAASGLTPQEIERRVSRELHVVTDLSEITGC